MKEQKKVEFIFKQNPELSNIGTMEQYLQYLKTIFPKSSTHSIFFHGGRKGIETFVAPADKDNFIKNKGVGSATKDYGIYFTADRSLAEGYTRGHPRGDRQIYPVVLDMKNPYKTNVWFALRLRKALGNKNLLNPQSITNEDFQKFISSKGFDSILWCGEKGEAIVFDPKQVHILGSDKDLKGFRQWIDRQKCLSNFKVNTI